jgi:hypothetical protein
MQPLLLKIKNISLAYWAIAKPQLRSCATARASIGNQDRKGLEQLLGLNKKQKYE